MSQVVIAILPILAIAVAAILLFSVLIVLRPGAETNTTVVSSHDPRRSDPVVVPAGNTLIIETSGVLDAGGLITNKGRLIIKGTLDLSFAGARFDNYGNIQIAAKGILDAGDHKVPGESGGAITNRQGAAIMIEEGASFKLAKFHNQGTVNNHGTIINQGVWYMECGGILNNFGTYNGTAPSEDCRAVTPTTFMSDTTAGNPSLVYAGRLINAEFATADSALIGKKIDSVTIKIAKEGKPLGSFQVGAFNADLTPKKLFATGNATLLPDLLQDFEFKLPDSEPLYVIQAGDRIGIKYSGGDAANGVNIAIDRTTSDAVYDGSASYRTRYESKWLVDTGEDLYMMLKQTRS